MKPLFILLLTGFLLIGNLAHTQVKVGYTNVELILAYMPETTALNQQIQTYEEQLAKQLNTKQLYAQERFQDYQKAQEIGASAEDLKKKEAELMKLQEELQKFAQEADYKVAQKRAKLLEPITEKLQKAIDDVADEKGYTYVLNQTSSSGVSTILAGPEGDDLSEAIMKKLGISIPGK